jgi:hypothetical protein
MDPLVNKKMDGEKIFFNGGTIVHDLIALLSE